MGFSKFSPVPTISILLASDESIVFSWFLYQIQSKVIQNNGN